MLGVELGSGVAVSVGIGVSVNVGIAVGSVVGLGKGVFVAVLVGLGSMIALDSSARFSLSIGLATISGVIEGNGVGARSRSAGGRTTQPPVSSSTTSNGIKHLFRWNTIHSVRMTKISIVILSIAISLPFIADDCINRAKTPDFQIR